VAKRGPHESIRATRAHRGSTYAPKKPRSARCQGRAQPPHHRSRSSCSSSPPPPSPPGEKATARQDQARQSSTGGGAGDRGHQNAVNEARACLGKTCGKAFKVIHVRIAKSEQRGHMRPIFDPAFTREQIEPAGRSARLTVEAWMQTSSERQEHRGRHHYTASAHTAIPDCKASHPA
jgi:hypothetical protein